MAPLPYALYTADQIREFDRIAIEELGIPGGALMERAGQAAFEALRSRWREAGDLTVIAGLGNNGGDGFVIARLAHEAGMRVRVLQLGDKSRITGDARVHADAYEATGSPWESFDCLPEGTDVIVDALLGTGLDRKAGGSWGNAIDAVNDHPAPVLSVDIPSGLNADTGAVMGCAVRANLTLTFIGLKRGLFTGEGSDRCGRILFDGLGVPPKIFARQLPAARRTDWLKESTKLAPRPRTAHKGHFGHALVVGGNLGYGGAGRLAAEAAARSGAGLVSLATRPQHVTASLAARPEIMARGVESAGDLEPLLNQADVIAIGPGLGSDDWAHVCWDAILASDRPLVVDADGLNILARSPERRDNWVLTPHPGEAARLLGASVNEIQSDRFGAIESLQARFGGVVVLKGSGSLIYGGGSRAPALCSDGNPGMASGGMGDVLTGLVGGLLAQGLPINTATEMAVCLHAASADRAAQQGEKGLLAGDLLAWVRPLLNGLAE